jgi:hypothetical protein
MARLIIARETTGPYRVSDTALAAMARPKRKRRNFYMFLCFICATGLFVAATANAEDKEPAPPRVAMCAPLAIPSGATTKVIVRGWMIDKATAVRSSDERIKVKILSKGSATIPNKQDAKQIGDQQIELEVAVSDVAPREVMLTIVTPTGDSKPHALLIGGDFPIVLDKESNNGFRQAQPIQLPQIIDGQLHSDRNVDVFSFTVERSTKVVIEVFARRRGSGLDSILTLYDARGSVVAVNDDHTETTDSRIEQTVPQGRYFIGLQDAHDHGGPTHPYRLIVRR